MDTLHNLLMANSVEFAPITEKVLISGMVTGTMDNESEKNKK